MSMDGISPSQSQTLSSTTSSAPSSSKQISQLYKQASQLFLTRRLQESLSLLETVITPSTTQEDQQQQQNGHEDSPPPITSVSSNLKIKVWNLYITILSAIVDLGAEEGKKQFGQKEWKALTSKVRDGDIWDTVVQVGYRGREGSVDADVVYNLATLLLNHSPSQKLNQERLENYLSSYGLPDLDIAAHIQHPRSNKRKQRMSAANGTDTPKDLTLRVRLIELFTLHVLPRNDEWDYAREFVNLSEVLDDEKKEAFFLTLDGLREEKERGAERAVEIQQERDQELERQRQEQEDEERRRVEQEQKQQRATSSSATGVKSAAENSHRRSSSEVDYGIEKTKTNTPTSKTRNTKSALKKSSAEPPSKQAKNTGKSQPVLFHRLRVLANLLVNLVKNIGRSLSSNPLAFLRTLFLVMGFIMALGRPGVRDRIGRLTGAGWQKVRGTVGMGVKVSYI